MSTPESDRRFMRSQPGDRTQRRLPKQIHDNNGASQRPASSRPIPHFFAGGCALRVSWVAATVISGLLALHTVNILVLTFRSGQFWGWLSVSESAWWWDEPATR